MKVSAKLKCTQKWHWELGYVTNGEMCLQEEKDELAVDRRTFGSLKGKKCFRSRSVAEKMSQS